jgi:hypothetical protein
VKHLALQLKLLTVKMLAYEANNQGRLLEALAPAVGVEALSLFLWDQNVNTRKI